ncbi:MAG: ABC transporter permease [Flavobacterium sp.]|nr:MAG: ABC transporter permease [Flavobacterium sp.]
MLKNWFKIFLYHTKNNKLFTGLNILGLGLGIAGLVFAILYWNDEHSFDSWNPENEKVFQMMNEMGPDMIWVNNISPIETHLKEIHELESYCYFRNFYYDEIIEYKGKKEQIKKITDAQNKFFDYFPFEFTKGDIKTALRDNTSIALSEQTALLVFGNEEPLGKQVQYSGRNLVVRGVYRIPGKSSIAPDAVTNFIDYQLKNDKDQWGNFNYGLLLKLKNPSQQEVIKNKIEGLYLENRTAKYAEAEGLSLDEYIKKNGTTKVVLSQLKQARLHAITNGYPEGQGNYQFLLIMVGLSVLILVLSVVNYVNLATANAIKRAKEVGVRKIVGASKSIIIRQFIFETILLTSFSVLIALVIVEISLPYYNDFLGKELVLKGSQFYLQLISIFIIVVIMAGIFPSVYVANFETLNVLKGNFGRSKNGIWLRNAMLVFQFAIASFFIIGSYIVYEQVHYMSTKDLGFKGEQVLDVFYRRYDNEDNPNVIYNRYLTIKQEISKIKGVEEVSAGAFTFGHGINSSSGFKYKDINIQGQNMAVDFEMLDMMQIKIIKGRQLSAKFASDTINSMLINKTAMKMMNDNPIGKEIQWNDYKLKIVGVVDDFHVYGPQAEIPPMAFFHFKTVDWMSYNLDHFFIKVKADDMTQTIADIEKFWIKNVDSKYPFKYDFVDKGFARTFEDFVKQRNLFSLLNVVVILIAVFGLFALASYSIERRMKEIAIRKTLGAETKTLLKELSKQYILFCVIGFLIALFPAYYLLGKWLENFAFRIDISILPFIIGFVVLLILTLIVVLSKAYQATRIDVLKYLKYE